MDKTILETSTQCIVCIQSRADKSGLLQIFGKLKVNGAAGSRNASAFCHWAPTPTINHSPFFPLHKFSGVVEEVQVD